MAIETSGEHHLIVGWHQRPLSALVDRLSAELPVPLIPVMATGKSRSCAVMILLTFRRC